MIMGVIKWHWAVPLSVGMERVRWAGHEMGAQLWSVIY